MYRIKGATFPANVGKLTQYQKDMRGGWAQVPDFYNTNMSGITDIRQVSNGKTTVTEINPLDPGDGGSWSSVPANQGRVIKAGRLF